MGANLATLLYLVAGIFLAAALRGLLSPASSRQGNLYSMVGMAIAIVTALAYRAPAGISAWLLVIVGMAIGGGFGAVLARRIEMTKMPQLVAFFHSLVGLAAVLVAAGALYAPQAFGIGAVDSILAASLVEMSLGAAIGAITFTGSVIAVAKLDGRMSGAPILLPQRHLINIALAIVLVGLIAIFMGTASHFLFFAMVLVALVIGVALFIPISGADMPVVMSMLNSGSGWAVAGIGFMLANLALIITGALVGASGAIRSYDMYRAMNQSEQA